MISEVILFDMNNKMCQNCSHVGFNRKTQCFGSSDTDMMQTLWWLSGINVINGHGSLLTVIWNCQMKLRKYSVCFKKKKQRSPELCVILTVL